MNDDSNKYRTIAREIALLSISQINPQPEKLDHIDFDDLILAATSTLIGELRETLETASDEVSRASSRLLDSEIKAPNLKSSQAMLQDGISLTQMAINRLGRVLDLPGLVYSAQKIETKQFAVSIISAVYRRRQEITEILNASMVNWKLERLPKIDQDILKIAVAEILFLGQQEKIAINEAVNLAKRYSDDDGYRFINGVLRRVSNHLKENQQLEVTS